MAVLAARTREVQDRRGYVLHLVGVGAGLVIAVAMLAAAVVLGVNGHTWLALALTGPSVFALVKIFVLRHAASDDIKQLRMAHSSAQPPVTPPAAAPGAPPLV
ncbi:hypothetical protein MF672_005990 [Actinomadura sp. ATCC 31491]|uniref:Uncharacterized protein n=1 Tax=Actinomadura luzonensis TaxID=2805427 RepID=A0ABT0FMW3_9ACTN|nr:hypothetical protein [Actinomadura luzonensis]MCK2213345.1 hypothetical protein [Actinomadura luzonensis]